MNDWFDELTDDDWYDLTGERREGDEQDDITADER